MLSQTMCMGEEDSALRSSRPSDQEARRRPRRRLKRAEQTVPHRSADAEVHVLSMVMQMVQSSESPPVAIALEVIAAMVMPVVHKGEIVVAGIQPEDQEGGDANRHHDPDQTPDRERERHDDEN